MLEIYRVGASTDLIKATKFESLDDMKGIADKLGGNFKADERKINNGFPILKWQD